MAWFSKKTTLDTVIHNAVDIHNHVLPAIDDGAANLSVTLEMLSWYKKLGFKKVIPTPHTMLDYYGNDTTTINDNFTATSNANKVLENFESLLSRPASEYMMDDGFEQLIDDNKLLFLSKKNLLVEFSYFQKPQNTHDLVFKMRNKGIIPILAHPERYRYINGIESFQRLKDIGFEFQLNVLSLTGHYGKDAFAKAKLLLQKGLYDYCGTDAHRPDHLESIATQKVDEKLVELTKPLWDHNEDLVKL